MLSLTLASILQKLQMPVVNQTGQLVVALASSLFLWLFDTTKNNKKQNKTKTKKQPRWQQPKLHSFYSGSVHPSSRLLTLTF